MRRRRLALATAGLLVAIAVFGLGELRLSPHHVLPGAQLGDATTPATRFPLPPPEVQVDGAPTPIPQFLTWVAARSPSPHSPPGWRSHIIEATRATSAMVVKTSLPPDGTAVTPAMSICSLAVEFMVTNSAFGLRSVGVVGLDNGELARGTGEHPCVIAPYLSNRL